MEEIDLTKLSILYVEDDPNIYEELIEILELEVGTLYSAKDGEEGLELFKKHSPDIIITDIQMPKMNGLEMCEKIREFNDTVPIIITTAFNEPNFLNRAIVVGVDRYLTKPIDLELLSKTIEKSAEIVFKRREVKEYEKLTKVLMDNNPTFMLTIRNNDFDYLNRHLLDFLGFKDFDEYSKENGCQFTKVIIDGKEETFCPSKDLWFKYLQNNPHTEHTVYLKQNSEDREVQPYKAVYHPYKDLGKDLIILNEVER